MSARSEARGEGSRLVRERRGEHEVAIFQRLLRLFHEPLRLFVLRSRVGIQLSVVHATEIPSCTRNLVARIALRGRITRG